MNLCQTEIHANKKITKDKSLILYRGDISAIHRHIISNICSLLKNTKRNSKLNNNMGKIKFNVISETLGCNSVLFFDLLCKELILWIIICPMGPSVKFRLVNSNEASDFNPLDHHRGSGRQILSFQKTFELLPHFRIIEGILIKVFKSTKYQLKTNYKIYVIFILNKYNWEIMR